MKRRTFIQRALLTGTVSVLSGCRTGGAKEEVLRALVEQVVVPNTAAIAESSRRLAGELARLVAAPSLTTLQAAREQWRRALSSWKRADVFRNGPIMDTNCLLRAMFWPVRTGAIDALLQGSQVLDDQSIDAMGVDRRGLFALEYLLHSPQTDEWIIAEFAGPAGERRGRLARALAGNVSFYADQVAHSLGNGREFSGQFAERGQDSLNRLVGQLVHTAEDVSAARLARISDLAKRGRLEPARVEGGGGRMSQQIALTYLRSCEQLYLGVDRGLWQLVKAQSATVDHALRSAFSQAIAAVSNLGLPLEEVAQRDPAALDAAAGVVKKLERALKTELASTLGVTMTFSSLDGD
ncbi:MAG TPA: imelysin family protein [Polyangiaceae bacterium]|nr:imelysin family protein [Polyangiaceae bacterium]